MSLNQDYYNGYTIKLFRNRFDTTTGGTVEFLNNSGRDLAYIEIDNGTDNSQIVTTGNTKSTTSMATFTSYYICTLIKNSSDNLLNWYVRDIGE